MAAWVWALVAIAALYVGLVAALVVAGRRADALAVARLIPDCVVLVRRLARDPRVPRRQRWLLGGLLLYLVVPIDLVPDFIPVAGQLDDALLVAWVLRRVLRSAGPAVVAELWPGPEADPGARHPRRGAALLPRRRRSRASPAFGLRPWAIPSARTSAG